MHEWPELLSPDCVSIAPQQPQKRHSRLKARSFPSDAMVGPSERLAPTISFTVFSRSNLWASQTLQAQLVELQKFSWLTRWHCLAKTRAILASAHLPLSSVWPGKLELLEIVSSPPSGCKDPATGFMAECWRAGQEIFCYLPI